MSGGLGRVVIMAIMSAVAVVCALAARSAFGVGVVDGRSMSPTFEPADILVTQRHPKRVLVGDVVVFPRAGWPGGVAHRVTAVLPKGLLVTRGDDNPIADRDPLASSSITGRVIARVPVGALVRRVASVLRRWYTHPPIAQ